MSFDWKFYVATIAAIAGILVPVWLWQADLSAHSLSVRLASSVALQTTEMTSIPDIQISIDGVNIKSPVLSTLVLLNDGSKPIPASDFESPIELSVGQETQIVRARISSVDPHNLKAELDTKKQSVILRPLLLNPEDTLTIAVITSGSSPKFDAQARIAGISKIKFEDGTKKKEGWLYIVKYSVPALLAYVLYWIYGAVLLRPASVRLGRVLSITTMLICALYFSSKSRLIYEATGFDVDRINIWVILVTVLLTGIPILLFIWRSKRRMGRA